MVKIIGLDNPPDDIITDSVEDRGDRDKTGAKRKQTSSTWMCLSCFIKISTPARLSYEFGVFLKLKPRQWNSYLTSLPSRSDVTMSLEPVLRRLVSWNVAKIRLARAAWRAASWSRWSLRTVRTFT